MKSALRVVGRDIFDPREQDDLKQQCVEGLVRACVQRRGQLKRDLAAEEQRLTYLRTRLAKQRRVAFIRVEALEREFGGVR